MIFTQEIRIGEKDWSFVNLDPRIVNVF